MFKHKKAHPPAPEAGKESAPAAASDKPTVEEKVFSAGRPTLRDSEPAGLRELMEKNLKWSQIIYEQNRRINNKLFWLSFSGWFKIILFIVLLGGVTFFLSPFVKQGIQTYNSLFGDSNSLHINEPSNASFENLIKFLPISEQQRAQLKDLFNKQ